MFELQSGENSMFIPQSFFPPYPTTPGPYTILDVLGGYEVALIWGCDAAGTPGAGYAGVLSRTPTLPANMNLTYLESVMIARGLDASIPSGLQQIYHGPDCVYPPLMWARGPELAVYASRMKTKPSSHPTRPSDLVARLSDCLYREQLEK
jgi:hypothetical protein